MILVVDTQSKKATIVSSTDFVQQDIWERTHIEEWVRENPQLLGEELMIVSVEFDRFDRSNERLDALALDRAGNLVVIEFKRTATGGSAELQALRYAAMISTMRLDELVPYYIAYCDRHEGQHPSEVDARTRLTSFVTDGTFSELSDRPRIVLCSQDFGAELTTTVLWLRDFGVDISCVRITPHRIDDQLVIVPARIIPLTEAESYRVNVRRKEEARQVEDQSRKEKTFPYLLAQGAIKAGDLLYLRDNLPSYVRFHEDEPTFQAEVTGLTGASNVLRWRRDGELYSPTGLARKVFFEFKPPDRPMAGINGSTHWALKGRPNLWKMDEDLRRQEAS